MWFGLTRDLLLEQGGYTARHMAELSHHDQVAALLAECGGNASVEAYTVCTSNMAYTLMENVSKQQHSRTILLEVRSQKGPNQSMVETHQRGKM